MVDTSTALAGLRKQALGENLNTWGEPNLNNNFELIGQGLQGVKTIALTGSRDLDATDFVENEVRYAVLRFKGGTLAAIPTVSVPAKANKWVVYNNESRDIIFAVGGSAGTTFTVPAGRASEVATDGVDMFGLAYASPADAAQAAASAISAASSAGVATTQKNLAVDNKNYSAEWANKAEDSPVSVAAGGDGVTTFSAKHHAEKAAEESAKFTDLTLPITLSGGSQRTLRERLEDAVHVFDFIPAQFHAAILGQTTNQDDTGIISDAFNDAIAELSGKQGGGKLWLPGGLFYAEDITLYNSMHVEGDWGRTILKLPNGSSRPIFRAWNPSTGEDSTLDYVGLQGLIVDGNADNFDQLESAASAVAFVGVRQFYARDCIFQNATGYGVGLQSRPLEPNGWNGPQENVHLENCGFLNNGHSTPAAGDYFDGLDVKWSQNLYLAHCWFDGNAVTGCDLRGQNISVVGGYSSNNGRDEAPGAGYGYILRPVGQDGRASLTGTFAGGNNGSGYRVQEDQIATDDTGVLYDIYVTFNGAMAEGNINDFEIGPPGTHTVVTLNGTISRSPSERNYWIRPTTAMGANRIVLNGCIGLDAGTSGIGNAGQGLKVIGGAFTGAARYGIEEEGGSASQNHYGGPLDLSGNGLGPILRVTTNCTIGPDVYAGNKNSSGDIIASAATLTLPEVGTEFTITGTVQIDNIAPSWRGREVTLSFGTGLTVKSGGTVRMAGGDLVAGPRTTLKLTCAGTEWRQISRSLN